MKKLVIYLLITLLFGTVFSIAISGNHNPTGSASGVSTILNIITGPVTAYADDTTKGIPQPPPPIPRNP